MTDTLEQIPGDSSPGYGPRQKIGLVLGPLLFAAAYFALKSAGPPPAAQWAGAFVVLMATWWITETLPLWGTACLPLLFPLFGIGSVSGVLFQYIDPINLLFVGGMWIAAAMEQWGLHRRIALEIVSKVGTSPRRIVLGFMLATGFITLWISNTAAALMMFPIAMAVLLKFEEEVGRDDPMLRRFGMALMLGIAYAASIGGIGTKIGTGTNLVFVKNANAIGLEVDFVSWLKIGMPIVLIALPLVWLYLVYFAAKLPAQAFPGGQRAIEDARLKLGRMSRGEKAALVAFLAAALLWIFRKPIELGAFTIPGWTGLINFTPASLLGEKPAAPSPFWKWISQDFGDAGVALFCGGGLLLLPVEFKPLRTALSVRHAGAISWDLLIMLGGGFAMAYGIQDSKLSEWFGSLLRGRAHLEPYTAMLLVCTLAVVLTEVASNTATASILLPLIAESARGLGLEPAPLMFGATLAASFGFMLPAGTPPNAIVFSSGYITVPQMARSGLIVDILGGLLVATVCHFLAPWALGIK